MIPARETLRRGWCPTTLRPMQTGDGLLVRVHPPLRGLTPGELGRLAAMARAHGNGAIEISARASLQIRGVTSESHPALVAELEAAGLLDEPETGPARLALVSALAGRDPADRLDARALAGEIEALGRAIHGLPDKTCVAVDGGGTVPLDGLAADIRLRALGPDAVVVGLPGQLWFGPGTRAGAIRVAGRLLALLAARHLADPACRRLADLDGSDLVAVMEEAGWPAAAASPPRPVSPHAGLLAWGEIAIALIALPFGRTDAGKLDALAALAAQAGATSVTLSPTRGLAIHGMSEGGTRRLLAGAQALGFVTTPDDPRLSVVTCAGRPGCTRAEADTLAAAGHIAAALPPGAGPSRVHVSGCGKGCAHPGPAPLTLVAEADRFRIARAGATRAAGAEALDLDTILGRLRTGGDLVAALR